MAYIRHVADHGDQLRIELSDDRLARATVWYVHREQGDEQLRQWCPLSGHLAVGVVQLTTDTEGRPVPPWVIGRAVYLAARVKVLTEIRSTLDRIEE